MVTNSASYYKFPPPNIAQFILSVLFGVLSIFLYTRVSYTEYDHNIYKGGFIKVNFKDRTNPEEIKRQNEQSGMSYNEAKEYIARTTGGHNTKQFSNTDIEKVKREING